MKTKKLKMVALLLGLSLTTFNGYSQVSCTWTNCNNITGQIWFYNSSAAIYAGFNTDNPAYPVDVARGDINVGSITDGYRINSVYALWENGNNECIFVGTGVGEHNTGSYNAFLGNNSGAANTSGGYNSFLGGYAANANTSGSYNTIAGAQSFTVNTTGANNCAFGYQSLVNNNANTNNAFGYQSLYSNTSGSINSAFGYQTLYSNVSGTNNNAFGYKVLYSNTGSANVAFGDAALTSNTTGGANTAIGYQALLSQGASSETDYNTAVGDRAGEYNTTGSNNTYLGANSGSASGNGTSSNKTFIGYGATESGDNTNVSAFGAGAVNSNAVNNTMMFGITGTKLYASSGLFATSDGRFKTNVTENVKGLAFINKLRPVTYNLNTDALDNFMIQDMSDSAKTQHKFGQDFASSTAEIHSGFIAQEVEQAAQQVGFTSSIVSVPANSNKSNYALNYAEIVVPLVKAVQELSASKDSLKAALTKQDSINQALQNQINQLAGIGNRTQQNNSVNNNTNSNNSTDATSIGAVNNIELTSNSAVIYQNFPNPFGDGTVIKYFIPENTTNAQIVFYDQFGAQLNTFSITATGTGQLNVASMNLAAGTYSYSLIINGKTADTKKMIKTTN